MMKGLMLRIPENLLKWTREKAALETISRGQQVSMNTVILELLRREMEADHDVADYLRANKAQKFAEELKEADRKEG
ncbi:MAG: hypothetical protein ABSF90_19260 [Syntrophobacteraceae bacterium]|jgi:hypothetical protein